MKKSTNRIAVIILLAIGLTTTLIFATRIIKIATEIENIKKQQQQQTLTRYNDIVLR